MCAYIYEECANSFLNKVSPFLGWAFYSTSHLKLIYSASEM